MRISDWSSDVCSSDLGSGHRNAPLLFDFHEIRRGSLIRFAAFHGAGLLDGAAEEQQLSGKRGFPGIRMADDAERPPSCSFVSELHGYFPSRRLFDLIGYNLVGWILQDVHVDEVACVATKPLATFAEVRSEEHTFKLQSL